MREDDKALELEDGAQATRMQRGTWGAERCRRASRPALLKLENVFYQWRAMLSRGAQSCLGTLFICVNPPLSALSFMGSVIGRDKVSPIVDRVTHLWTMNSIAWRFYLFSMACLTVQVSPIFLGTYAAARLGIHLSNPVVDQPVNNQVFAI